VLQWISKCVSTAEKNSKRRKISTGAAELTSVNGAVTCGGAVENRKRMFLAASSPSTRVKKMMMKLLKIRYLRARSIRDAYAAKTSAIA